MSLPWSKDKKNKKYDPNAFHAPSANQAPYSYHRKKEIDSYVPRSELPL